MEKRHIPRKEVVMHVDALLRHLEVDGTPTRAWVDEHGYLHAQLWWLDEGDPPPGYFYVAIGGQVDATAIHFVRHEFPDGDVSLVVTEGTAQGVAPRAYTPREATSC